MSKVYSSFQKYCTDKDQCIREMIRVQKTKKERKIRTESHKSDFVSSLQSEINKLARIIDFHFFGDGEFLKCVDCEIVTKSIDGGHYHSVGSNASLRFNLHNIHGQSRSCNGFKGGRKLDYQNGIISRYGQDYADKLDFEIVEKYKHIGLTSRYLDEKIKIVRKLIRDFDTLKFENPIQAREKLNNIIGIY